MNKNSRWNQAELGQTAVLFALMLIGLILFVGLAVDGGNVFNARRITQNAADASALSGVHYIAASDAPNETGLLQRINTVVESNGIPDTNGMPGDEVNDHVVAYYTDDIGARLRSPNCSLVGTCGEVPHAAFGVEVEVSNPVDTYLLGLIGRDRVGIAAHAVAVTRGYVPGSLASNVMIALGECETYDRQMTGRGNNNEFLGGFHSNSWVDSTGNNNHFHGQITYVTGYPGDTGSGNVFEPGPPAQVDDPLPNPFDGWSYTDFAPGTPIANAHAGNYWDVSILDDPNINVGVGDNDGIVSMREITNHRVEGYPRLYNDHNSQTVDGLGPNQLRTGIYYAGDKEIRIGETASGGPEPLGTNGTVTIVSGNRIKTTEKAMNLSAYMGQGSAFPGLLFFSDFVPPYPPCEFHTEISASIDMAGNGGGIDPEVYHYPDDLPRRADPADYVGCPYPRIDGCYVPSNAIFTGLIYAPHGRVDTSDSSTTYIGAIVAYTIDYSGDRNLFISNPALFPTSFPMIYLER
jgi:hypothetical protein